MAIYEYSCPHCRHVFELMRPMSKSDEPAICPRCGARSNRLLSVFASTAEGALKLPADDAFRES